MNCGWCKTHKGEAKKWQEYSAKLAEKLRILEVEKAIRDRDLQSELTMNAKLTEEIEILKDYEWMYKKLAK